MSLVMMFFDSLTTHLIVVAGIQTQMLRFFLCRPRALDHDRLDCFLEQEMGLFGNRCKMAQDIAVTKSKQQPRS